MIDSIALAGLGLVFAGAIIAATRYLKGLKPMDVSTKMVIIGALIYGATLVVR